MWLCKILCIKLGGEIETNCLVSTETVNVHIWEEIHGKYVLYYTKVVYIRSHQ